jgi:hypothetical protein
MQFGKAFTFVFEDPKWLQKVGIAALIILIPIVGPFAVFGWSLEVTRRVINNDPELLPTFSDFVGHLMRGLKAFVIGLVYVLPIILVSACSNGLMVGIGSAASNQNSDVIGGSIAVLTTCIVCFASIYGLPDRRSMGSFPRKPGRLSSGICRHYSFRFDRQSRYHYLSGGSTIHTCLLPGH